MGTEKCFIVYKTTNLINGKIYVGQHTKNDLNSSYKGSGKLFWAAVEKYGWENFNSEIIDRCTTQEDLDSKEEFWIKLLDARNPEVGYNLASGGRGSAKGPDWKHSDTTKRKLIYKKNNITEKYSNMDGVTGGDIIKFIIHTRLKQGLSMKDLSERCGVRAATICDIENGRVSGNMQTIKDILWGLGYELEPKKIQGQKN